MFMKVKTFSGDILELIGMAVLAILITAYQFSFHYLIAMVFAFINWFNEYREYKLKGSDGSIIYARNIEEAVELSDLYPKDLKSLKKRKQFGFIPEHVRIGLVNDDGITYELI